MIGIPLMTAIDLFDLSFIATSAFLTMPRCMQNYFLRT